MTLCEFTMYVASYKKCCTYLQAEAALQGRMKLMDEFYDCAINVETALRKLVYISGSLRFRVCSLNPDLARDLHVDPTTHKGMINKDGVLTEDLNENGVRALLKQEFERENTTRETQELLIQQCYHVYNNNLPLRCCAACGVRGYDEGKLPTKTQWSDSPPLVNKRGSTVTGDAWQYRTMTVADVELRRRLCLTDSDLYAYNKQINDSDGEIITMPTSRSDKTSRDIPGPLLVRAHRNVTIIPKTGGGQWHLNLHPSLVDVEPVAQMCDDNAPPQPTIKFWCCNSCNVTYSRKAYTKPPVYSLAAGFDYGNCNAVYEAGMLKPTAVEESLISRVHMYSHIVKLISGFESATSKHRGILIL